MAHTQKPDFVFRRNGRVHLNRQERQFSRLLAAEVCASAVVILNTPSSEVVWRVLTTHSIRQFPLHVPSRASPCAITFQLDSTMKIVRFTMHIFSVYLLDTLKRGVYVQLYCYPTTFPHSPRHIRDIYHIVGRAFCSLLTEVGIMCHQRSCHTCFHLAIIFNP